MNTEGITANVTAPHITTPNLTPLPSPEEAMRGAIGCGKTMLHAAHTEHTLRKRIGEEYMMDVWTRYDMHPPITAKGNREIKAVVRHHHGLPVRVTFTYLDTGEKEHASLVLKQSRKEHQCS